MASARLIFAIVAAALFAAVGAMQAHADLPGYVKCVREKTRAAQSDGGPVNLRAIRALCRQIHGEDTGYKPPGRLSGVDNNGSARGISDACIDYAKEAKAQADYGVRSCGFDGARYTQAEDNHLNWCRSARLEHVESERQARVSEIEACNFCRMYLDKTLGQFEQKKRCLIPVAGPLWQPNPSYVHFNWCMEKPAGQNMRANPETFAATAQRDADLQSCGQGPVVR